MVTRPASTWILFVVAEALLLLTGDVRAHELAQSPMGARVRSVSVGSEDTGLRISVPEKWVFSADSSANSAGGRYRDRVELVVDNRRIGATSWQECKPIANGGAECDPFSGRHSLSQLSQQMLPGEVQLKISVSMVVGPFRGSGPFADTVGSNLRSLLSDAVLRPTGEPGLGLTSFSFSFSKRGIPWKVSAFAKGTISEGDKRDLDAMLQSLRFIDGPVASDQWAAYLAWQQLPPKERKFEVCWILPHGQCGPRLVSVTKAGAAYVVTFRNSEVQNNVSTWKYRVEGMGKVTPIP